jgi:hypothetical protein
MQTVHIQAEEGLDSRMPYAISLQTKPPLLETQSSNLDETLALILQTIRDARNPKAMDALGRLLNHIDSLEKERLPHTQRDTLLILNNQMTLTM